MGWIIGGDAGFREGYRAGSVAGKQVYTEEREKLLEEQKPLLRGNLQAIPEEDEITHNAFTPGDQVFDHENQERIPCPFCRNFMATNGPSRYIPSRHNPYGYRPFGF